MFLALLCLKKKGKITSKTNLVVLPSFGFNCDGTFDIKIESSTKDLKFGLLSANQINHTIADDVVAEFNSTSWSPAFETTMKGKSEAHFKGTIIEKGVYYPFVISPSQKSYDVEHTLIFANPEYHMDYRMKENLYTSPIMLCLTLLITALWLTNWFCNFSVQIYIHYFFTAQFVVILLSSIAQCGFFIRMKVADDVSLAAGVAVFFDVLRSVTLLIVMLLAAKGWGIIIDTIKIRDLAFSLVISTAAAILLLLADLRDIPNTWSMAIFVAALIVLSIYIYQLTKAIEVSSMMITAHMLVIQNAGIDPTTTPVQKKQDMYNHFHYTFIMYLVMILIRMLTGVFIDTSFWINSFLIQLSDFFLLVAFYLIFRIRDKDNNGYTIIGDNGGEEFLLTDIEAMTQDNENQNGIEWKPGMKLPSRPVIVKSPSVAIIETPEGVEEVNISVENHEENATPATA